MKKVLIVLAIGAFAACNNSGTSTTGDTATKSTVDTSKMMTDTSKMMMDTTKKVTDTTKH